MKKTIGLLTIAAGIFAFAKIDNVSAYTIDNTEIPNSTYVIGNHMFTRESSDNYNGTLTTNVIMLASKTIQSNELDDMIIYYKNARGVWLDALTGNTIQITDKVDIQYKNLEVYIEKPVLSTIDTSDGKKYTGYENGEYLYDFAMDTTKYVVDADNNKYTIDGYEVYEKNGTEYKSVKIAAPADAASIGVEVGTKKTFVARVFVKDESGNKVYSDYSNEIVIDHTKIATPTIGFAGDNSKTTIGYEYEDEDLYDLDDGFELYEKNGDKYVEVTNATVITHENGSKGYVVTLDIGEKKTFVVRTYALNKSGEKVYSDYSNEHVMDNKLEAPVLGASGDLNEDGDNVAKFGLDYLASSDGYADLIDGWVLYEKNGDKYTEVTYGTIETDEDGDKEYTITVKKGEKKTFVAKAYALNKSGEKVYSDYSNEYDIDNSN